MNRYLTLPLLGLSLAAGTLSAEEFDLGKLSVVAEDDSLVTLFEESVDAETIEKHSAEDLAEAVGTISGVFVGNLGGRGETTVSIRGFDSRRIAVFADGVPIYVPYDGNFDYGRFQTSDLGEIVVSKGFSSVLYGANTFGGVINLVSRKPTRLLEVDAKESVVIDSNGKDARSMGALNVGTRQNNWYMQLGVGYVNQNHYRLSDDYEATAEQPEGERLHAHSDDRKGSIKVGYVADDGSEAALSYLNQHATKEQPPVTDTAYSKVKYWDWPYWDKESLALNGKKRFEKGYVKGNLYYDAYENSLYSYDDGSYSTMTKKYAFKSRYDDYSCGGRLEGGMNLGPHLLKAALNYKRDVHRGYDLDKVTEASTLIEDYRDNLYSAGVEGVFDLGGSMSLIAGVGYDYSDPGHFYDTNTDDSITGGDSQDAFNPQIALVYALSGSDTLRASIAQKTHLPTMKDRYSRKLGTAVANPDLDPETATHYELAYRRVVSGLNLGASLYYSRIEDAIESVYYTTTADGDLTRNENVGDFAHTGIELEVGYVEGRFEGGVNYTYIDVENLDDDAIKSIRVPEQELFAYTQYALTGSLDAYANMRFRKGAYSQDGSGNYLKIPTFATIDVKATYAIDRSFDAEVGVKNLFDKNYAYDLGFPEAGREFFAGLSYRY